MYWFSGILSTEYSNEEGLSTFMLAPARNPHRAQARVVRKEKNGSKNEAVACFSFAVWTALQRGILCLGGQRYAIRKRIPQVVSEKSIAPHCWIDAYVARLEETSSMLINSAETFEN
jgi:hypothetical protein